jgi:hypothetical protein
MTIRLIGTQLVRRQRLGGLQFEIRAKKLKDPISINKLGGVVHASDPSYTEGHR